MNSEHHSEQPVNTLLATGETLFTKLEILNERKRILDIISNYAKRSLVDCSMPYDRRTIVAITCIDLMTQIQPLPTSQQASPASQKGE